MQATIYVTSAALATALEMDDLGHYARVSLADQEVTNPTKREGYYLKSPSKMKFDALPLDAQIKLRLSPDNPSLFAHHVHAPDNLRGCVFENAPDLPSYYGPSVQYWSGEAFNPNNTGAVYYQCPENEYMVSIIPEDWMAEGVDPIVPDRLLSEGVVFAITGLRSLTADLAPEHFIEVQIPLDEAMLGVEADFFRSSRHYSLDGAQRRERIFLKVDDVRRSPDPDNAYIELRQEWNDYGYVY
jgi:hypothetical protein